MGKYDPWHTFFEELDGDRHRFDIDRFEGDSGVSLPPSARKHAAWWSSAQYYAIWSNYGWRATPRLATNEVIFTRTTPRPVGHSGETSSPADREQSVEITTEADLVLIGCVAQKQSHPAPARDLYTSSLWKKRRRYAESTGKPWMILSAEHGLVAPDEVIAPYDRYLESQPRDYREQWSRSTANSVIRVCRSTGATTVEIHAGSAYIDHGLEAELKRSGIQVLRPLKHLRRGEQLAWYNHTATGAETVTGSRSANPAPSPSSGRHPRSVFREAASIIKGAAGDLGRLFRRSPTVAEPMQSTASVSGSEATDQHAVVDALLAYGDAMERRGAERPVPWFTPDEDANRFLVDDPFAFLVGVIADYQIKAERAWALPYLLSRRLGSWSPEYLAGHPREVEDAFKERPSLHRFPSQTARWVVEASQIVADRYDGDAFKIWAGRPRAADLQETLRSFNGISQKKAAMAVEILERNFGVPIVDMEGSDIAYDVHIRRVFLRTGLAEYDDMAHMVESARRLHPQRPGALDYPAWDIGRTWCHPSTPACPDCPIGSVCPRFVERAATVEGA